MKTVRIKYHDPELEQIVKKDGGNWMDLRAAENVFIPFGKDALISLGVSIELPAGYEAHIVPRSSTFKNFGSIQTNHFGIIDTTYCGDNDIWKMGVVCLKAVDKVKATVMVNGEPVECEIEGVMIKKGDRICQFEIRKTQEDFNFVTVDHLGNADRGGFGSTGIN